VVWPGTEDVPFLWSLAGVLPSHRRRGIGGALLRRLGGRAGALGKEGLQLEVREDEDEAIRFVEKRGFREIEREHAVELDLTALAEPKAVEPPAGVEIVPFGARRDLEREVYALDREASE